MSDISLPTTGYRVLPGRTVRTVLPGVRYSTTVPGYTGYVSGNVSCKAVLYRVQYCTGLLYSTGTVLYSTGYGYHTVLPPYYIVCSIAHQEQDLALLCSATVL
jgi:hypothetical protein